MPGDVTLQRGRHDGRTGETLVLELPIIDK